MLSFDVAARYVNGVDLVGRRTAKPVLPVNPSSETSP
jgi:hypothetical protein